MLCRFRSCISPSCIRASYAAKSGSGSLSRKECNSFHGSARAFLGHRPTLMGHSLAGRWQKAPLGARSTGVEDPRGNTLPMLGWFCCVTYRTVCRRGGWPSGRTFLLYRRPIPCFQWVVSSLRSVISISGSTIPSLGSTIPFRESVITSFGSVVGSSDWPLRIRDRPSRVQDR